MVAAPAEPEVQYDEFGEPLPPEEGEAPLDGEAPTEGEEGAPEVDEAKLVTLPGRRPGEAEMEVVVEDPLVAERLRQMKNGYMRGEDAKAIRSQAEQVLEQAEEVKAHIATDPIAFVHENLRPEFRLELAYAILTDPQLWPSIAPTLQGLTQDPQKVEMLRADLNARRYQFRESASAQIQQDRAMQKNARAVSAAIQKIVPPTLRGEQARLWVSDALQTVGQYVDQSNLRGIDPSHLPMILAQRLQAFGVDPTLAAQRLAGSSVPSRPAAGRPGTAPARRAPGAPAASQPSGQTFVAGSQARRAVAAIAPAGAGAPAGGMQPAPKGAGIKEAIEHARKQGVFRR
ncbi:MAG TPA: hypothetical protein VM487_12030 [Phycisphaerae bacterium]|nr:hypothetical protein [Phycisphaerae bacterium]